MKKNKTRKNRSLDNKVLKGGNIQLTNQHLIMNNQSTMFKDLHENLKEIHKNQFNNLKYYQDLSKELSNIKQQNQLILDNNRLTDLEKNINHCTDMREKKKLLKQARELHKKLYPENSNYNDFLKKLDTDIGILNNNYSTDFHISDAPSN
tara:strand:- start:349 stop:798 length:450 start_codon:yes stop_codon:yes gene_type:complete